MGPSQRRSLALHLTTKAIFRFWVPLAATWLMMAAEGPFLAAIVARLADPKFNLAAHGVAFAMAILVEAPVIMLMSASTALVEDSATYRRLRNFSFALSVGVTALMLVGLIPRVFDFVMQDLIGLPDEIARLTYIALWILLPWPGAIGYRRFYQGLLIRRRRTRLVAYGTVIRLVTMATTALVLYLTIAPPGAYVGAAALSLAVCVEAIVSRFMAAQTVRELRHERVELDRTAPAATYRGIAEFYYPLALTSFVGLVIQPLLTFFMGRAAMPVESLAVYPVVHALSFVFRAMGLSYQEVAIALMGPKLEDLGALRRFAFGLGTASSVGLAVIALTPVADVWFQGLSGLSPELAALAIIPAIILIPFPFLSVLLALQRAILVKAHVTRPITAATTIEVLVVAILFVVLSGRFGLIGVTAAVSAFLVGRLGGNLYLIAPIRRALRAETRPDSGDS